MMPCDHLSLFSPVFEPKQIEWLVCDGFLKGISLGSKERDGGFFLCSCDSSDVFSHSHFVFHNLSQIAVTYKYWF